MSRKKIDISKLNLAMIGDRLAYIRNSKGLNMEAFGQLIGLTKGNISNIESHKYEPSFKVLVQIYKQFRINSDWLLTGEGEPYLKHGDASGDSDAKLTEPNSPREAKVFDAGLLKSIIMAVENELKRRHLVLDADKKAEAIALLYEMYAESHTQVTKDTIGRYLKLVA